MRKGAQNSSHGYAEVEKADLQNRKYTIVAAVAQARQLLCSTLPNRRRYNAQVEAIAHRKQQSLLPVEKIALLKWIIHFKHPEPVEDTCTVLAVTKGRIHIMWSVSK